MFNLLLLVGSIFIVFKMVISIEKQFFVLNFFCGDVVDKIVE